MDIETLAGPSLARDTLRRLSRRSDLRGLGQLGLHIALLCATGFIVSMSRGHPWLVGAWVLHGAVLCFLFCPLHESIHGTAFASRWLNDLVAWICGAVLMLPPTYFRLFHFAHHRFTQDPARDPELAGAGPMKLSGYLWRVSGLPYWLDRVSVTLRHALTGKVAEPFVLPELRVSVVREARFLWAGYAVVLAVSIYGHRADALVFYWLIPAVLGQPFLRLFLLAEHSGCAFSDDMFENTRTTLTNAVIRGLTWRMSYHAEHHSFPTVPFHALPELHSLIGQRIRVTASGYLTVHRQLLEELLARGK